MERGWRQRIDETKDRIMDGYRRGVCNKDGASVRQSGVYIGKPRSGGSMMKTKCYRCGQWYRRGQRCEC